MTDDEDYADISKSSKWPTAPASHANIHDNMLKSMLYPLFFSQPSRMQARIPTNIFISTTNKHKITKNVHEITYEVLTGQVIEERQALRTISTWPT